MTNFYDFSVQGLDGSENILAPLRGKVTLAVNVASRCGYTPQYAGLEDLHRELKDRNFTVVGFPCNQFGAQEPGTAAEIQNFCSLTYGWLTARENGFPGDIAWNFEKFLIDRDGRVLCRYPSGMKPTDSGLLQDLADAL